MEATHDISGCPIFGRGTIGQAHVLAHRHLDAGDYVGGHGALSAWLEGRRGSGSQWVHVQWHMVVFELAIGSWDEAYARFREHILPAAWSDAATDAPAALWRLALSAPRPVELPWGDVRACAMARMSCSRDPFVELHDLLALAGAGDTETLDRWLAGHREHTDADRALTRFARALRCYAAGEFESAAASLARALPELNRIGGSRAQNELFLAIYRNAAAMCVANDTTDDRRAVGSA